MVKEANRTIKIVFNIFKCKEKYLWATAEVKL